ncbi:MAG: hypothetical protein K6U03_00505 [Firmicutes bacterium]|nr:hypothetical protein [Bacillota bacterium]
MSNYGWLPELVKLEEYAGDWDYYLSVLYSFFKDDFINSSPRFKGMKVGIKRYPLLNGKEASFWHIISSGEEENSKVPDLRRCERIRWPRPIIDHFNDAGIKLWEQEKNREQRVYLWLEAEDYLVVLSKRGTYCLLWTAFVVNYPHYRDKLQKQYEAWIKAEAARNRVRTTS